MNAIMPGGELNLGRASPTPRLLFSSSNIWNYTSQVLTSRAESRGEVHSAGKRFDSVPLNGCGHRTTQTDLVNWFADGNLISVRLIIAESSQVVSVRMIVIPQARHRSIFKAPF